MITYDLRIGDRTSVIGVAYLSQICRHYPVSVIEDQFTAVTATAAAHELGHGLGIKHDSLYGCSNTDAYVMSSHASFPRDDRISQPWQFSKCSAHAFTESLRTKKCTLRDDSDVIVSTNGTRTPHSTADQQCALAFGGGSYLCRHVQLPRSYDVMCTKMYCRLPRKSSCGIIIPQDLTSCGNKKWCQLGKCTTHKDAPATIDNCPQGDAPFYRCRVEKCSFYSDRVRKTFCCKTCTTTPVTTSTPRSTSVAHTTVTTTLTTDCGDNKTTLPRVTTTATEAALPTTEGGNYDNQKTKYHVSYLQMQVPHSLEVVLSSNRDPKTSDNSKTENTLPYVSLYLYASMEDGVSSNWDPQTDC
ncbi:A disintegrin and metalloproteinase with thrombospondin motifs 19-like [Gigantopelta aegis]|uniref:A disintegrin and metalloproteinase with thrombospondin motifs 19-like n=1 Tax=Gigantopelta aegis TaxID=1735272 RepID=UPI001B8892DF|nr:A disintegrin and metalloproteinase with thrombospondin motifs 19-like [Gigantopelta aegis]